MKEVEAAAERAAAQSAAIIEEAMAQAEETRRRAEQDTQSQVQPLPVLAPIGIFLSSLYLYRPPLSLSEYMSEYMSWHCCTPYVSSQPGILSVMLDMMMHF